MFHDRHHIIYDKSSWTSRPEAKALREDPSLIIRLDRLEHNEIHRFGTALPLLGYYALTRVQRDYEPGPTPLRSVENLMGAIEHSSEHPKTHPIQKQLAELAVWALDLQRPFIAGKSYER